MNITSSTHLQRVNSWENQERSRLLGRIEIIQKSIKNPKILAVGIVCSLGVWQLVLLIQLKLTKDKLKKFPERSVEIIKSTALNPPLSVTIQKNPDTKSALIENKPLAPSPPLSVTIQKNPDTRSALIENKPLAPSPPPSPVKQKLRLSIDAKIIKVEGKIRKLDPKVEIAQSCLVNTHYQDNIKAASAIEGNFRKHNDSKMFSSQKESSKKIDSFVRAVLVEHVVKLKTHRIDVETRAVGEKIRKMDVRLQKKQTKIRKKRKENLNKALKEEKQAIDAVIKMQRLVRSSLAKKNYQENIQSATVIQSAFRKHKASKIFSSQKKFIIKIQSFIRGVLVKIAEHKKKEAIRKKKLIINTIEAAFSKVQEAGDKKAAFAKLKTHSNENKIKELEETLERKEKESFGLDCALFQEASKNETLATKFVIAKFRLARKNETRIREEKTKAKDAAQKIQLEELKNARVQRKRVLKS